MSTKSQPTRRAQEMFAVIEKYLTSGLQRREFCEQESITYSTFHWWFHQYRKHNSTHKTTPKEFVRVNNPSSPSIPLESQSACVVEYPNGVVLRFSVPMDVDTIAQLVNIQAG
jgi:hypothetical protein